MDNITEEVEEDAELVAIDDESLDEVKGGDPLGDIRNIRL